MISDKLVALSDLGICYILKNIKKPCGNNKFKISGMTWDDGMKNLKYLKDLIMCQIVRTYFSPRSMEH